MLSHTARIVRRQLAPIASRCIAPSLSSSSSLLHASSSAPLSSSLLLCRTMANKEQRNRDKENMKKKTAKRAEAKKAKGAMKDKEANISAGDSVGVSVPAMEERMQEYIDNMRTALSQIKAGRVVPSQLDELPINAHGQSVPLKAVATVSARNATTLLIQLYDPSLLKEVDKAIRLHNNALNPQQEESALVVVFPKVTKEVRDGLVKTVKAKAEETRTHLRTLRQNYLQQLKGLQSNKEVSADLVTDLKGQIQASHDVLVAEIKKLQEEKEKEIQQV